MSNKNRGNNQQQQKQAAAPAVDTAKVSEEQAKDTTVPEGNAEQLLQGASEAMQQVAQLDQEKAAEGEASGAGEDLSNLPPAEGGEKAAESQEPVKAETSAPAATNQGVKEIKVGAVVDPKQAKLGKEASESVKQAISQESTSKPVDRSTAFEQKLAKIIAGDNGRERDIALQLQAYVKAMAPGVPLTPEEGARQQATLFRIMRNVVEQDDSFKEVFRLTILFFKEYKDTVFSGSYIHRFYDSLTLSPRDSIALARLVNLFQVAAGVNNKTEVSRLVNLNATFSQGLTDSARDRVVQYFNT